MKKIIFTPYSSIIFLKNYKIGIFLCILSFILPSVGVLGFISLISVLLFTKFLNLKEDKLIYNFYLYNSILVGMGIGYFFNITYSIIILTMVLSIFTFLISFFLKQILSFWHLPILSIPFSIVSIFFYLASLKYSNLLSNILNRHPLFDINIPFSNFFKTIGEIFFLPYNIVGIFIFLILFYYSRILVFLGIIGYIVGIYFHSLFIPLNESINNIYNFNYMIIAMAIGGIFLIPSINSYIISIIGVLLSIVIIDSMNVFFNMYSIPVYTVPFNLVVILFLMLLYWIRYKYYNYNIQSTPEKSLSFYISNIFRFKIYDIKIYLPFIGKWTVYQEFDDKWTHKGKWKYAYDFVIKQNGKTYKNEGLYLEDYYAFGKEVVAPVNGYIIDMRNDLPDNFIGNVDKENNWGNYIIIKCGNIYVEISHLMQYSIPFKIGDYVKVGDIIGKCGNSGYSPEPHIHIQVQKYPYLGSETIPFIFVDYIKNNNNLIFYDLPKKEEEIENLVINKNELLRLNFILDDEFIYEVFKNNKKIKEYSFKVNMNDNAEYYFIDNKGNKLFFAYSEHFFYFYKYEGTNSYLKKIFLLAPKIPFSNEQYNFEDFINIEYIYNNIIKLYILLFIGSFRHKFLIKKINYKRKGLEIKSKFGKITFSFYEKGFNTIEFNNIKLVRKKIKEKGIN